MSQCLRTSPLIPTVPSPGRALLQGGHGGGRKGGRRGEKERTGGQERKGGKGREGVGVRQKRGGGWGDRRGREGRGEERKKREKRRGHGGCSSSCGPWVGGESYLARAAAPKHPWVAVSGATTTPRAA